MSKAITEESGVHKEWKEEAKKVKTPEELAAFVHHLIDDYEHDYGTIIHAIFAASLAAYSAVEESPQGGITGFQAGCLMWMYIEEFGTFGDCGLRIIDFENLLYTQCSDKFQTITEKTWANVQEKARKQLGSGTLAHPDVLVHWKSIVDGVVPFGLTIKKEEEPTNDES